jgi:aminoglycoside/choline kinase family phosphotransferase
LPRNETTLHERLAALHRGSDPPTRVVPLVGDASTRSYYRAFYPDGRTSIVMLQPSPGSGDEAAFLDVHRFLEDLGLPVPRVRLHDPLQGLILLEDLGDDLLENAAERADPEGMEELYRDAVDLLLRMRRATDPLDSGCVAFGLAFDREKLMQEMEFFLTHFVRGFCGLEPPASALGDLFAFFELVCGTLAAEPRVFTHRDYHARNLMLHKGRLVMIDFQDARMGPAQYDLASLLYDSYVSLPEPLIDSLAARYAQESSGTGGADMERFFFILRVMALQRNIKALGTFGFQSTRRGSTRYLSAIPRTGGYVARNLGRIREFERYGSAVEDYIRRPAAEVRAQVE